MKRILLKGPDTPDFLNQSSSIDVYKEIEITGYLESFHPPQEIFIHAHGTEHFQENLLSRLLLALFPVKYNSDFSIDESKPSLKLAHEILTKIVKNTVGNQPNIVHILACHAGAAQHNIQDIEGDIVLCTYAPAANFTRAGVLKDLFDKYNNSKSLIEYITNNLPLLSAVNFTVSYKLNDNVQTLSFDHSTIKTMDMYSFLEFLQEQYRKVTEFYKLQSQSYPILFPARDLSEIKQYTNDELKQGFNTILDLYSHEFTNSEIIGLLKIDNLDVESILHNIIERGTAENANFIINNIKFDNSYLMSMVEKAIKSDKVETANLIIINTEFNDIELNFLLPGVIKSDNIHIFKSICNKIKIINNTTFKDVLTSCLPSLREEVTNLLLPKTKNISSDILLDILFEFLDIPKIIDDNIKKTNLEALKLLWNKLDQYEKLNFDLLRKIIKTENVEFNEFLFNDHNHEGSILNIAIKAEFNDLPLINKIVKLLKSEYYIIQITPKPELNEIDPVTVIGADDFTTIAK